MSHADRNALTLGNIGIEKAHPVHSIHVDGIGMDSLYQLGKASRAFPKSSNLTRSMIRKHCITIYSESGKLLIHGEVPIPAGKNGESKTFTLIATEKGHKEGLNPTLAPSL